MSQQSFVHTTILPAIPDDSVPICGIIKRVAHHFSSHLSRREIDNFLRTLTPVSIALCITNPRYNYMVSLNGREIIGVAGLKDCTHLLHFFVSPQFQRCGVGRQLWESVKSQAILFGNTNGFTVNATSFAVPIYERFGFCQTGPRVDMNGITFTPMRLMLPD